MRLIVPSKSLLLSSDSDGAEETPEVQTPTLYLRSDKYYPFRQFLSFLQTILRQNSPAILGHNNFIIKMIIILQNLNERIRKYPINFHKPAYKSP